MKIHQILPNFSYGDAIGDDTLALRNIFRALGHESEIFAGVIHPYLVDEARHWKRYREVSSPDNILIYHVSVGSEITDAILEWPDKLVIIFHNITPPEWFFGVSPHMTELAVDGMDQLRRLQPRTTAAWADSEYNAGILRELGYPDPKVLPIIVDFSRLEIEPSRLFTRQWASRRTTWLFVGRVTPNKKHEDVIRAFTCYKRLMDPSARLFLTGDVRNCDRYAGAMVQLVRDLGVGDVVFTGMIDDDELAALYRMSDVYVCMSEHEGFCVPLLEAMYYGLPVVAFDAGAVRETMGGAGVLVRRKDPVLVAGLIHELMRDDALRNAVIEGQRRRLESFFAVDMTARVRALLDDPALRGRAPAA